jgi:hypothetical protein
MPWLIHTTTFKLKYIHEMSSYTYAILSHTWRDEEITFDDMQDNLATAKRKAGWSKIEKCCQQASQDELEWIWVDTCCIDKTSSSELSEAINSMWKWYSLAMVCYVHLDDVSRGDFNEKVLVGDKFSESRWFTRGWTLQELLIPLKLKIFSRNWRLIGVQSNDFEHSDIMRRKISQITGIGELYLSRNSQHTFFKASVATRMSWASKRTTTREEDMAYCLMGLFNVNMPILYGEGVGKAFRRLQIAILERSGDHSLFAWEHKSASYSNCPFADSPEDFQWCSGIQIFSKSSIIHPFSMYNVGLSMKLPLRGHPLYENLYLAPLNCQVELRDGKRYWLHVPLDTVQLGEDQTAIAKLFRRAKSKAGGLSHIDEPGLYRDAVSPLEVGDPEDILILDWAQEISLGLPEMLALLEE